MGSVARNSINCNPLLELVTLFVDNECSVRVLSPPLFGKSI